MKNMVIILLIIILLPLVLSLNIEMKQNFQPGETFMAGIESNLLSPLTADNIYFYSDREQIPLTFDVARMGDKHYIYALLPPIERNYTLKIKNMHYFENGAEKTEDVERNFSVSGNITDFSVYPGFIIARQNFSLTLESKSQTLNIEAKFLEQTQNINLPAGEKKKIYFSIDKIKNFTITEISISALNTKYSVHAAIIPLQNAGYESNITESDKLRFDKKGFYFVVNKNKEKTFNIYLRNFAGEGIKNIKIELSKDFEDLVTFDPGEMDVGESESKQIKLTVKTSEEGAFNGEITATSENYSAVSDIIINSVEENVNITANYSVNNISNAGNKQNCMFLGGRTCTSSQNCDGTIQDSIEGQCCIGNCVEKKSYTGIIIGVIIILAVLVGLFFLYKKSKKKPPSSSELLKQKQKAFEGKNSQVQGNLTKS